MAYETTGEGLEQIFFFLLFITIAMFFIAQQSFVNYINHVHIVDCLFIFDTAAIFSYLMLLLSHITCQFNHAAYIVNLQQKRGAFQTEDGIGVSTILCSKHNGSKRWLLLNINIWTFDNSDVSAISVYLFAHE